MAGDWIKLRKSVLTHPRLIRTMSALNADRLRTLGGIVSAWCLLDEQTADGKLDGYTPEILDELVGLPGLARAMESAGWLVVSNEGLQAPNYEKHNGATAKRRAQDNDRKTSARNADKVPQPMRTNCGPEKRREEKRREKRVTPPPTLPEIQAFCTEAGLPPADAEATFHKWTANGFTNNAKPIKDWKATIRAWKAAGYMPSQKATINGKPSAPGLTSRPLN